MLGKLCIAAILVAVGLAGCGSKKAAPIHRPDKVYSSLVSLSPGVTEIAYLHLGAQRLVGRTSSCNYPVGIERVPVMMSGIKPDLEAIAKAKADLILYDPIMFSESDVAKLKELNIELYAVKAGTVKEFEQSLSELGGKLHVETNVWEYIDKINAAIASAMGSAEAQKPKVAVIMPGEGSEHYIAGLKSYQADLIRCSGGDPVGPDANRFVPINAESLISMNPDIIIVTGNPASVLNDTRFKTLAAVKNKKVLYKDQDMMLRAGARIDTIIPSLAKEFQP